MHTTNPLARLFGRSPFGRLQEHMRLVEECAGHMLSFFEAARDRDEERLVSIKNEIFRLEHEADIVKSKLRSRLPRTLFLPVDRSDILALLSAQDGIADKVQDIAGLVVLRNMEIPDFLVEPLFPYIARNLDAVNLCVTIINELDELLEIGFRGRGAKQVRAMLKELHTIETDTDRLGMEITSILFRHEEEIKPLNAVYWGKVLGLIGEIADRAENVGNRLRLFIAR